MYNILFIGATHGDEAIGADVLAQLANTRNDFDWIIGNEEAIKKGTRYSEDDLNRSAPGDKNGKSYEARRAAEIIEMAKQYRYTIDLHGATNDTGIFIIITNPTEKNLRLASMFRIPRIVLWKNTSREMQGPLSECFPCGIEIECGKKSDPRIKKELCALLNDFLDHYMEREKIGWRERLVQKQLFEMYGPLKRSTYANPEKPKEFQEITIDAETFTPVFIGSYDYDDILAYKLRKISLEQALSRTV